MKRFRYIAILLSLALFLMSCQLAQQVGKQTADRTPPAVKRTPQWMKSPQPEKQIPMQRRRQ